MTGIGYYTDGERLWTTFHLHHVLACLEAGRPDNAASWIWRDVGEQDYDLAKFEIDPTSLLVEHNDTPDSYPLVHFRWILPDMIGEGI